MGHDAVVLGPVQLLIVGFEGDHFTGEILGELSRLRDADLIRLIDLEFVKKEDDGDLTVLQKSDLTTEEAMEFGAIVGALVGLAAAGEEGAEAGAEAGAQYMAEGGHVIDEDNVWYIADAIPNGTSAGIALIEHRWAVPLRDAIARAGGVTLADEWIHASDLLEVGLKVAEAAPA